jgi:hypothetical protein
MAIREVSTEDETTKLLRFDVIRLRLGKTKIAKNNSGGFL